MSKLNTFKSSDKGEQTREHVRETALRLFREKGFDATTMRDIAAAADLSLGAAYYYYSSKEAIVAAYYDYVQAEHLRRAGEVYAKTHHLKERLAGAIHTKLDILEGDRKLLAALFRYGGDPDHPLNWFGPATKQRRDLSMLVFAQAVQHEKFPADIKKHSPLLLWAMHMGILLYFLYDNSPGQKKTRRLADGAIGLAVESKRLLTLPLLRPLRKKVFSLLEEAGLLPEFEMPAEGVTA